jgi:hypothetical protein
VCGLSLVAVELLLETLLAEAADKARLMPGLVHRCEESIRNALREKT